MLFCILRNVCMPLFCHLLIYDKMYVNFYNLIILKQRPCLVDNIIYTYSYNKDRRVNKLAKGEKYYYKE